MFPLQDRPTVKPEHKRQPSNTRIRLKLMPVLIKSREAAVQFPSCIQVQNPPPPSLKYSVLALPFLLVFRYRPHPLLFLEVQCPRPSLPSCIQVQTPPPSLP